ncbi:hypothetical protein [Stenotrophomonas muris]|uniref:hypothetical protein n=1 Tax=Stenotrophomonas muris TaxID=2963283 RepID=UPI00320AEA81
MSSRAPPPKNAIGLHALGEVQDESQADSSVRAGLRGVVWSTLAVPALCGQGALRLRLTSGFLLAVWAVSLLLLGIGARVPAAGRLTIRRLAKGAGLGLLAGLLAQVVVLVLEAYRFSGFRPSLLWQLAVSLMVMSVVLLTPLWGVVLVALTVACRRDNNPHQASNP